MLLKRRNKRKWDWMVHTKCVWITLINVKYWWNFVDNTYIYRIKIRAMCHFKQYSDIYPGSCSRIVNILISSSLKCPVFWILYCYGNSKRRIHALWTFIICETYDAITYCCMHKFGVKHMLWQSNKVEYSCMCMGVYRDFDRAA